ncbi:aminotransferase class III-fold pyridoxal phosphate-dependent enzyme [Candidatus Woesearchaeota archaeon]|nr:aminotransferase class III-fold pyridoxal phosphate-dependent enzyme [Candidatus Woesearchaeota archaeon]
MADLSDWIPYDERSYEPLGPKDKLHIKKIAKYSANNYSPYPFVVDRAEGFWLYNMDGHRAVDLLSAYSAVLKHRHEGIIEAVENELRYGSDLVSRALCSRAFAEFAEMICTVTKYDRVLPKSDGGSITDSAVGALFMHGHKKGIKEPEVILTTDYFHGRALTFGANAFFDEDQYYGKLGKVNGIKVVDHTAEAIKNAINKNTVGIFIETHKGEGGPLFTKKEDFLAIKKVVKDNNLFFGCDEIQTGLGRCGYLMAWQEFGEEAKPDFVTLGKALGGGVIPVSALLGTEEFMSIYRPGLDGSTHGGYPPACAAGCASLKYILEEGICEKSLELGQYFTKQLNEIEGVNAENRGLLIRLEIEGVKSAKPACYELLLGKNRDPRVFMKYGHKNYARIAPPPGAIVKETIDWVVEKTLKPVLMYAKEGPEQAPLIQKN